MIYIETIDLAQRGVQLPHERVGMVIAQPYLQLTASEPYRCDPTAKTRLLAVLDDTFEVARSAAHGVGKTHFTIFPEYSIPGIDGVGRVDAAVGASNWPTATIVIGGTDALSQTDFLLLAAQPNTHVNAAANDLARVNANEWVNCSIVWIKSASGQVERWLQPKLHPAWPEQNIQHQDMFCGQSAFMFKGQLSNGTNYRFSTLICFDWIATIGNQKAWRWVIDDLRRQAEEVDAELALSWFFVIQNNPRPSHHTFLNEVSAFFNQADFTRARRERACLVFANSAGKSVPGRADSHGGTSLLFSGQTLFSDPHCQPTFSNGGFRFRASNLLDAHRDVYFRERGSCIHSFAQINPDTVNAGAAGRALPIERAYVYPLGSVVDPRAPRTVVPACIKWLNDELDALESISAQYPVAALMAQVDAVHQQIIAAFRAITSQSAAHAVKLAACQSQANHADEWGDHERAALEHLVHTLDILALGSSVPTVGVEAAHATATIRGERVDIFAILGASHEACLEKSKQFLPSSRRSMLLISRDKANTEWHSRFGSILETKAPSLQGERRITDPRGGLVHLGYSKLLTIYRGASNAADVQGGINAHLAA